jgi:ankyrin repeat protein
MYKFHKAMNDGTIDEKTVLFNLDFNSNRKDLPHTKDVDGHYLLFYACKHEQYHNKLMFRLLVENPEAIMEEWQNRNTNPLHVVCSNDQPEHITMILERNPAILNYVNEQRQTPLQIACKSRCTNNIVTLLKWGNIDLNSTDKFNCTALHYADANATRILLKQNRIDLNIISNRDGATPFISYVNYVHFLIKLGRSVNQYELNMIILYIKKFPNVLSWKHPYTGNNLVHHLIDLNDDVILRSLLPYIDCVMNEGNYQGMTPLHLFFGRKKNKQELFDVLIRKPRIQLNLKCNKGFTALHYACCKFHLFAVLELIYFCRKNIEMNLKDKNGNNPLHAMLKKLERSKPKTISDNASTACQIIKAFLGEDKRLIKVNNDID